MWYLLLSTVNRVFICILLLIHGHEWGTHEMAPCNMPRWNIDVSNRMRTNEKVFINSYVWPQQSCWALWFSFSFLSLHQKKVTYICNNIPLNVLLFYVHPKKCLSIYIYLIANMYCFMNCFTSVKERFCLGKKKFVM